MSRDRSSNCDRTNPYQWGNVDEAVLTLFKGELVSFIPPGAFDAHAHSWQVADLGTPAPALAANGPSEVSLDVYRQRLGSWLPERCPTGGLFFPFPTRQLDVDSANQFLAKQLMDVDGSLGLMMITPQQDPQSVEQQLIDGRFAGFKVYHLFAEREDTFLASPDEFIPEWAWELAEKHGLAIMLHLVLPKALAEPVNQQYIREHCLRYPHAKLILAHAARGFCSQHTVDGIDSLRGLSNVFFDTSAICEAAAFAAILKTFGPTRLLFGTDFCVSEMRSRCVNLADGFLWLDEVTPDWSRAKFARPTLLGLESLLALKQACRNQHLSDGDVEEIFCLAARRELGVELSRQMPDAQKLYHEAKQVIPGGTQLLSKRPEMFAPEQWPAYYREARGCEVIDIEGNRYIDMSLGGILACILGYSDPDVNAAVIRRVTLGSMATLQTADEVDLAKLLIEIHPWAGAARFTRAGGESMAVAVRIARAYSGKSKIALCGYHGWHDWYLAANLPESNTLGADQLVGHLLSGLEPKGVPEGLRGSTLTFHYNQPEELDAIIKSHGDELAAIVMEPTRHDDPEPGFLEGVREHCDRLGIPLIFDEISSGWRQCLGGAHLKYGVAPDIAVFAKALANGFPMGAILGTSKVMQAAQETFISSTFWTEGIGPAAALACIRKMQQIDVPTHLARIGSQVLDGWQELANKHGISISTPGRPTACLLKFEHPEANALLTLMTARMLKRGFLAGGAFNPMLAHEEQHVQAYLAALDVVFAELAEAIQYNNIHERIGGPVKHSGFTRLT